MQRGKLSSRSEDFERNGDVTPTMFLKPILGLFSGGVSLWIIPIAAVVFALYLWTPKTGKGVAIYAAICLAMLILYFVLGG